MAGNGASGHGFANSLKVTVFGNGVFDSLIGFVRNNGLGDENGAVVDILATVQTLLGIIGQTLGIVAAVLLAYGHFAVLDFNAGLQIQQICAQCGCGGATAAFDQIVQLVNNEGCFHFLGDRRAVRLPDYPDP